MAHFKTQLGIVGITGALKKTTEQGVNSITVTRKKHIKDPLSGEIVATGPSEIYIMDKRDYNKHPLTPAECKQRKNWQQACREAQRIIRDKTHPRYMELYRQWRAQLDEPHSYKQFPAFVRTILLHEQ